MNRIDLKKRLLSALMIIVMVLSVCACTEQGNPETNDPEVHGNNSVSGSNIETDVETYGLYSECGELSVDGAHIVDASGAPCVLRGVSTHGIAWFPQYVCYDSFEYLRDKWGINTVRLSMYTAEYNGYCTGNDANRETLKSLIENGIEYATELDMYVIVDWHILSDGNPNTYKSEAIEFFTYFSKKYADYGNVIYEICNEPNGAVTWQDVKSYAQDVISAIRKNDSDCIIIVGSPTWSQDIDKVAADPIKGEKNIVYSLHFYAATHGQWLRDRLSDAVAQGLPVIVSEFGISDASGNGSISISEGDAWIDMLDELKIGRCIWSLSNKDETSALIGSGCTKLSGWKDEELTGSGRWYKGIMTGERVEDTAPPAQSEATNAAGCTAQAKVVNTWYDGRFYYLQCEIKVSNGGEKTVSGWNVTVRFTENISQEQVPWNGSFIYESSSVKVSGVKSNSQIPAGGSVKDIGFIVKSTEDVKLAGVAIED